MIRLVPDIANWWKWISTWGLVALASMPQIWASLPPDVKEMAPMWMDPWILTIVALGTLFGRMVDQ